MLITLNNTSSVPLYRQIVEQIRAKILTGHLRPGDPLPSIRQLASDLLISVITIKRAYQDLESEGLIQTQQGRGTFVSEIGGEHLRKLGLDEVAEHLRAAARAASRYGVPQSVVEDMLQRQFEKGDHVGDRGAGGTGDTAMSGASRDDRAEDTSREGFVWTKRSL